MIVIWLMLQALDAMIVVKIIGIPVAIAILAILAIPVFWLRKIS